jgi:translocation protein SEC63
MRLQAYLAQALPPTAGADKQFLRSLEENDDPRINDAKKRVMERWGRVEIVDAAFKVIGESFVTPSSIVYLLVKLRISPPGATVTKKELSVEETKRLAQATAKEDEEFLSSREDAEDLDTSSENGFAHAPLWPATRKPSWWIALADDKANRLVVPPLKISDIPYSRPNADRNYRAFKIQFQCPPNTGLFTWKIYIVSDTFAGEEAKIDIALKVEEPSADDEGSDDDISDPDEDSLAGQMAAMRGGSVKKIRSEESDDESSTDDDKESTVDSDSDSD